MHFLIGSKNAKYEVNRTRRKVSKKEHLEKFAFHPHLDLLDPILDLLGQLFLQGGAPRGEKRIFVIVFELKLSSCGKCLLYTSNI